MRYQLSREEMEMTELIAPYLEWEGITSKLKPDAPEEVKKAYEKVQEIVRERDKLEMELLGIS